MTSAYIIFSVTPPKENINFCFLKWLCSKVVEFHVGWRVDLSSMKWTVSLKIDCEVSFSVARFKKNLTFSREPNFSSLKETSHLMHSHFCVVKCALLWSYGLHWRWFHIPIFDIEQNSNISWYYRILVGQWKFHKLWFSVICALLMIMVEMKEAKKSICTFTDCFRSEWMPHNHQRPSDFMSQTQNPNEHCIFLRSLYIYL